MKYQSVNLKLFVFKMNERESIESVKKNFLFYFIKYA
jgi:hypothetical protein